VVGFVGDPAPIVAEQEAWNPRSYDEVIVATLPTHVSRLLRLDSEPHNDTTQEAIDV